VVLPVVATDIPRWTGRTSTDSYWIHAPSGVAGYQFDLWVRQNDAGCSLSIDSEGDTTGSKARYDRLFERRGEIETAYGEPLQWDRLDDKKTSVITAITSRDGYRSSPERWPSIARVLSVQTQRFENALRPFLSPTVTHPVWIFQSNPDRFDIDGSLAAQTDIRWLANQHAEAMKPGQLVYIWRNRGENKATSGIVAVGVITSAPAVVPDLLSSHKYWSSPEEASTPSMRVSLRVLDVASAKGVVKSEWLSSDPVCASLPNLRMRQQTNYQIEARHSQRLARLWGKTGRDFDRLDLLIALRAYDETFGKPISELAGSPVANAALLCGRAVSSIYSKVMNFRAMDSRVAGVGQANAGAPTEAVWKEFWNGSGIDRAKLERSLEGMMSPGSEPTSLRQLEAEVEAAPDYSEEGRRVLVTHYRIERNRQVVDDAKAAWFAADPLLRCSVCRMSFVETYGAVGEGFIEAHHVERISTREGPYVPDLADLVPICANCHRMVHRLEGVSIEQLRNTVAGRSPM
jgi:predicted HNH restriction endonuclease